MIPIVQAVKGYSEILSDELPGRLPVGFYWAQLWLPVLADRYRDTIANSTVDAKTLQMLLCHRSTPSFHCKNHASPS